MTLFASLRAVGALGSRHRRGLMLLLLALVAAGGYWDAQLPPRPRTAWTIPNPGDTHLTPDGKYFLGLSAEVHPTGPIDGAQGVGPVRLWDALTGAECLRILDESDLL